MAGSSGIVTIHALTRRPRRKYIKEFFVDNTRLNGGAAVVSFKTGSSAGAERHSTFPFFFCCSIRKIYIWRETGQWVFADETHVDIDIQRNERFVDGSQIFQGAPSSSVQSTRTFGKVEIAVNHSTVIGHCVLRTTALPARRHSRTI